MEIKFEKTYLEELFLTGKTSDKNTVSILKLSINIVKT